MNDDERSEAQARWDERHVARDPIESPEPDPTVMATAARLHPGRALDLATGDGRNALALALAGWQVTAVDFSAVGLERARAAAERKGVRIDWLQADLLQWRAAPRSFDLVLLVYLHLPPGERRPVYAMAAEAVAPGGTLLVVGHDLSNLTEGTGGPQDPAVLFSPEAIAVELGGLRIERAERVVREVGPGARAIDAVVEAMRP